MANKKECAKNNRFNGNKYCGDPHKDANRFFCRYTQDRSATGVNLARFRREMNLTQQGFVDFLEAGGYLRITRTTLWNWETQNGKKQREAEKKGVNYGYGKIGDEEIEALCAALSDGLGRLVTRGELVVYKIREIDDERDQLAPLIITYFHILTSICLRRCSFFC